MNRSRARVLISLLVLLTIWSCGKREGLRTVSTYTFTNGIDDSVHLDLYKSAADYNTNRDPEGRYTLAPGSALPLSLNVMHTYWLDWYTSDYSFHNWTDTTVGSPDFFSASPRPRLEIAAEDEQIVFWSLTRDTSRSILLRGNESSTTWLTEVRDGFPVLHGRHEFLFRKDFTGQYTFTPVIGEAKSQPVIYQLFTSYRPYEGAPGFRVIVRNTSQEEFSSFNYVTRAESNMPTGIDTLMVHFLGFNKTYPAFRQ